MRLWYLPFAKNARDVAPHYVGDARGIKGLGHPPYLYLRPTVFNAAAAQRLG